ncbi:adenosylcobalamin-dependent ribonucleoside-diphosphate reductase [Thiohalophilus thiocyanatoxydans]|uniref:Vitamin B12-dependent ribonucleotide reductase n=1 Tax=Thiohalophilus thiocyanatoxydans TaxID=381308 RepID=A0A4R8IZJ2_9GAMM|nr:adenosylcobalamin-dependent ribonucleoside-diphosphate reductase [Thiohalophilus thiocyanatoxydans]TDY02883.1 ribonucleoside-diphosphate reductase class II [Thiohalophilus thiocyanatoxydans]
MQSDIANHIWETKYRYYLDGNPVDTAISDTWQRVALAAAQAETESIELWQQRFYELLKDFRFLPGGRILAGAGTDKDVTLFNCFVMGTIEDSMDGIFDALKEAAITMQQGGGVGYDFSTLRPRGFVAHHRGTVASGPVSFMRIWDAMCATVLSTGARRGAMMATLRCDHPDIEEFIHAKQQSGALTHFNLSVLVTDTFMEAVSNDDDWPLIFPLEDPAAGTADLLAEWPGYEQPVPCKIVRRINAQKLWQQIMRGTYAYAEPGVLFYDRINRENNLAYRETIAATNPCGEIPLPPYGACNLGSLNLTCYVQDPFSSRAQIDMARLQADARLAVRFLDNVIDISRFPLARHQAYESGSRRIGLGITGLADTLMMLGLAYASDTGRAQAEAILQHLCHSAYAASIELAREKTPFPFFQADDYLRSPFIRRLPDKLQQQIRQYGIRNSHLVAIAPTGTISLFARNVSSGIEPVYDLSASRRVLNHDGEFNQFTIEDDAWRQWRQQHPDQPTPDYFQTALQIAPRDHLKMQAQLQPHVDNAISKTINVPQDYPFEEFVDLYRLAYESGLKGCTTYRPNPVTGAILSSDDIQSTHHCCSIEREAD